MLLIAKPRPDGYWDLSCPYCTLAFVGKRKDVLHECKGDKDAQRQTWKGCLHLGPALDEQYPSDTQVGDMLERGLSKFGITKERYKSFKAMLGLPADCLCPERQAKLNEWGEKLGIGKDAALMKELEQVLGIDASKPMTLHACEVYVKCLPLVQKPTDPRFAAMPQGCIRCPDYLAPPLPPPAPTILSAPRRPEPPRGPVVRPPGEDPPAASDTSSSPGSKTPEAPQN